MVCPDGRMREKVDTIHYKPLAKRFRVLMLGFAFFLAVGSTSVQGEKQAMRDAEHIDAEAYE